MRDGYRPATTKAKRRCRGPPSDAVSFCRRGRECRHRYFRRAPTTPRRAGRRRRPAARAGGRPPAADARAVLLADGSMAAACEIVQVKAPLSCTVGSIKQHPAVGAPGRREIDRLVGRHLEFVRAVQMRKVDFFEPAAAVRYVGDAGVERTRRAGEVIDDLVGEAVRDAAEIAHLAAVSFSDELLPLINVEQAQLDGEIVPLHAEAALHETLGVDGRPVFEIETVRRYPALRTLDISRPVDDAEPAR